jgi:DnaJ homolog subfamily C member 9
VSAETIEAFSKEYKGSEEERTALLKAYTSSKGNMDMVYEMVMLSGVLEDDERFRRILDEAIEKGEVEGYKKYTEESEKSKQRRRKKAEKEAEEAREWAEELGLDKKLNGAGKAKGNKAASGEAGLAALIQQRQKARAGNFFADLEAKYAPKQNGRGKGSKKRGAADLEDTHEPPEEAFEKTAARATKSKKAKNAKTAGSESTVETEQADSVRKSRRNK